MSGRVAINMMRPVKIEDLLVRESVNIDNENVQAMLAGKRILVTGAGGSIGSELCRQLARFAPACIVLVESSEFALYLTEQWFTGQRPEIPIVPLAGDEKDTRSMAKGFVKHLPQVVVHAATVTQGAFVE